MIRSWHRQLFIAAAILLLVALGATIRSAHLTELSVARVLHTDEVMARFLRLRALLSEAEATARSYALAGDTVSLALMGQSRADALLELRRVQEMTVDSAPQQELLKRVSELVQSRFASFDLMVAQRGGLADPKSLIPLVDEGRGTTRALQARLDEGLGREQLLFEKRNARRLGHLHSMNVTAISSAVLAVIIAAVGLALMKRAQKSALKAAMLELDRAKAEHASQMKSRFLANVSHEIRTPMTALLGYAELLSHASDKKVSRECVEAIQTSGKSMLCLVNDLLDLSRIEAGRLNLTPEPVSIRQILRETEQLQGPQICDRKLAFICRTSPEVPPMLMLDPLRVKQVLVNLVSNALKFTSEGSIALEAFGAKVPGTHPKYDLQLRVSDTGPGIARADQQRIFGDYEQVCAADGRRGTGLGLSITRQLVQLMGGTISLKSEPGEGSFFTVNLPGIPVVPADNKTELTGQVATGLEAGVNSGQS